LIVTRKSRNQRASPSPGCNAIGATDYDEWFGDDLNNAKLNSVANYYDFLPGFRHLLELNAGDLNAFYDAVQLLADLPKEERHRRLRMLAAQDGSSTVRHQ